MLLGYSPVSQALLGTLLTWGLTAAGSALVFVFSSGQVSFILQRIFQGAVLNLVYASLYSCHFAICVSDANMK